MALNIPILAVPTQKMTVGLANQTCQITVRTMGAALYVDLSVNNSPIILGVIGRDRNRIVRSQYLGFLGDLTFVDNQGTEDPVYTGLGTRFDLCYLTQDEVAAIEAAGE